MSLTSDNDILHKQIKKLNNSLLQSEKDKEYQMKNMLEEKEKRF